MYGKWCHLLLEVAFCCLLATSMGKFTINRRKGASDIIKIESNFSRASDLTEVDKNNQHAGYQCRSMEKNRNPRLTIVTYVQKDYKFTCISKTELDTSLGVTCKNKVLTELETYQADCEIKDFSYIRIWTYRDSKDPWNQFSWLTSASKHVKFESLKIEFDKAAWAGLLVEFNYVCGQENSCAVIKFPGNRTYPLPGSLSDILRTPLPTTKPPVKSSSNTGIIIGIVFGCFLLLFVLVALFFLIKKRKRRYKGEKNNLRSNVYGKCEFDIITKIEYKKDEEEDNVSLNKKPVESEDNVKNVALITQEEYEEPEYHSPDEKLLGRPTGNSTDNVFKFLDNTGVKRNPEPIEPTYNAPDKREDNFQGVSCSSVNTNPEPEYSTAEPGHSKPELDTIDSPEEPDYSKPEGLSGSGSLVEKAFNMNYGANNNPDYYSTPCSSDDKPLISPTAEYAQVDKSKKNKVTS